MRITSKIRKQLLPLLDGVPYRKIISEKLDCHANTVSNVLLHEHDNAEVATEILLLAKQLKEKKQKEDEKAEAIIKKL